METPAPTSKSTPKKSVENACKRRNCGQIFCTAFALALHMKEKHPDVYKCTQCSFSTKFVGNFKRHMTTHSDAHPYVCSTCESSFKTASDKGKHEKLFHSDQPRPNFTCTQCEYSTYNKGNLAAHELSHSEVRDFRCDQCESSFKTSSHLKKHVTQVHCNERPYKCTVEGCTYFGAKFPKDLATHLKFTHATDDIIPCTWEGCGRLFKTPTGLRVHLQTHTGERPHKCTQCDYSAKTAHDLNQHVLTHSSECKYKCDFPLCDFSAHQKSNYLRHFRSTHSEEAVRRQKVEEEKIARVLDAAAIEYRREAHIVFCEGGHEEEKKFARLDFTVEKANVIIIISVDEYQHNAYLLSCEQRRISSVCAAIRTANDFRPIVWVRYNPHTFRINGNITSVCGREQALVEYIRSVCARADGGHSYAPLSLVYMFYSCVRNPDGSLVPTISKHADFNTSLAECIIGAVVSGSSVTAKAAVTMRTAAVVRKYELLCRLCKKPFDAMYKLRCHESNAHGEDDGTQWKFKCPFAFCCGHFEKEVDFTEHLGNSHNLHGCGECGYFASTPANLKMHVRSVHQRINYRVCDECGVQCSSHEAFAKHVKTHETA